MQGAAVRAVFGASMLALAGCFGSSEDAPDLPAADSPVPQPFDHITDRLDPASGESQVFDVEEDSFTLPGGGRMSFHTGRGMHCVGDADSVAPNATGWVACAVRVVSEPTAMAQDVHELGIGLDAQRLTLRMAAEAVAWRLMVSVSDKPSQGADAGQSGALVARTVFDSGWRRVDLSPVIDRPIVEVVVQDPCDVPASVEDAQAPSGWAVLYVNFTAAHGAPFVHVDLSRSVPGVAQSSPFAQHDTSAHGFTAQDAPFGLSQAGTIELRVDLEAPETPTEATPGACALILTRELQEWKVDVGIVGADGRQEMRQRSVRVEVLLEATAI